MIPELLLTIYAAFHFYLLGGTFGRRLLNDSIDGPDQIMVGFMLHYLIVGFVNLFVPIGLITTLLLSGLLLLIYRRWLKDLFLPIRIDPKLLWVVSLVILFILPYWSGTVFLYDHYLYHDQTIKWFHSHAVPAGLANFHGRFGFNNATFPVVSSFQTGLQSGWYFINTGMFVLYIYKAAVLILSPAVHRRTRMGILILTGTLYVYTHLYLAAISPDAQVAMLTAYLLITLAADGWTIRHPGFVMCLLVFMVATKVNMAVFAFSLVLAILWMHRRHKPFWSILILPLMIGVIWVIRSLVLTGQLLYPFPGLYLTLFDYSVPLVRVQEMHDLIVAWARSPGPGSMERYRSTMQGFGWVREWYTSRADHAYTHLPNDIRISLKVILWFGLCVSGWSIFRLLMKRRGIGVPGLLIFAMLANLCFWFLTGPDFRFGLPILHALLFIIMVSGAGGKLISRLVFIFYCITLPFQLKDVAREYVALLGRMPEASWWSGHTTDAIGDVRMIERGIPDISGTDTFRYIYPEIGDRSRLDVFPAAPSSVENVVFERRLLRLVFMERCEDLREKPLR